MKNDGWREIKTRKHNQQQMKREKRRAVKCRLPKFIVSIQFLNKTIFKDAIDFFYEFTGTNSILLECGMKNQFMEEYYHVEYSICSDILNWMSRIFSLNKIRNYYGKELQPL